jgi:trimeric autotransporter adhesin
MEVDVRDGLNRIQSSNEAARFPAPRPSSTPARHSAINQTNSLHKRERQTNHQFTGSLTKNSGPWIFKAGSEYRVFLSNYTDADRSTSLPAPSTLAAGRGVKPAFSQKYFALYSQNDWRATNRLTIFLGLRWDLQPAPTERHNRLSAFDFGITNPYGTPGGYAFPGVDGYDRHLWDVHHGDFGPRIGFGYKLGDRSVIRGGYGISDLPTNTGYFDGPSLMERTPSQPIP